MYYTIKNIAKNLGCSGGAVASAGDRLGYAKTWAKNGSGEFTLTDEQYQELIFSPWALRLKARQEKGIRLGKPPRSRKPLSEVIELMKAEKPLTATLDTILTKLDWLIRNASSGGTLLPEGITPDQKEAINLFFKIEDFNLIIDRSRLLTKFLLEKDSQTIDSLTYTEAEELIKLLSPVL